MQYSIKQVKPNIFAVVVKNDYDLAMLFCRVQEFYESPNPKFRGQNFSIWDFVKWYSSERNGSFTYPSDWAGFNIPFEVLEMCIQGTEKAESPYDVEMQKIYNLIKGMKPATGRAYIIGVPDTKSDTFIHEVCHGLYYVEDEYRSIADSITGELKESVPAAYFTFKRNLLSMGYTEDMVDDEIQAYLTTNWENKRFGDGVKTLLKKRLHTNYTSKLEKFFI
jgi:hypothetical protein